MKRYAQIAFVLSLAVGIAACSPAPAPTQQAASLPQPTSVEAYHPLSARTGIEEVDSVLDALASGDARELRSLIQFTNAKCTRAEGLGGPPKCLAGETEGTPVEVLPFLGSEGSFLRKDEIDNWQGVDISGVYALYEVSPDVIVEEYYPAGEYALMLVGKESQSPVVLRLSAGRLVRVDYPAGDSSESLKAVLQREAGTLILPPLNP